MTTYTTVLDGYGDLTLWRSEGESDQHPTAIALLLAGQTAVRPGHEDDHGVVFRAAAAVLAPDEAVDRLIRLAISDPGAFVKRVMDTGEGYHEPVTRWSARAVQHALRTHAETSTTTERTD